MMPSKRLSADVFVNSMVLPAADMHDDQALGWAMSTIHRHNRFEL